MGCGDVCGPYALRLSCECAPYVQYFSTGRRFARDVRDGSICSWIAEECLNFARITRRWFFQQFYTTLDRTGHIIDLNPIDLGSLDAVLGAWERFGLSLSLEDFNQRCADFALYLKNHRINGQHTFPVTLQPHTHYTTWGHTYGGTSVGKGTCGSINASASNVWLPNSPKRYLLGAAAGKGVPSWLAGYD